MRVRVVLVVGGLLSVAACDCDGEPEEPAAPSAPEVPTGIVEGVVRLAPGADVPAYIDEILAPNMPPIPDDCPALSDSDRRPTELGADRGLEGVVVAAADFGRAPPYEPAQHEIVIENCRLAPRIIVAPIGDVLIVRNRDSHPWLPQLGSSIFAQALLEGQARNFSLERGGSTVVACGASIGPFCGRTDVVVTAHPVVAVTGEGGRFRIPNVPAKDGVRIGAWHPLFVDSVVTVDVRAGETHRVEITLTPAPPVVLPEPRLNFTPEVQ